MLAPIERSHYPSLYKPKAATKYKIKVQRKQVSKSKSMSYLDRAKSIEAQLNRTRSRSDSPSSIASHALKRTHSLSNDSIDKDMVRKPLDIPIRARQMIKTPPPSIPEEEPRLPVEKVPVMRTRGRSDASELRKYIATRKLQALQAEAEKEGVKINIKYPNSRRRSLSEGSVPLSVIMEEEENDKNEKKLSMIKRWWKKLRSRSKNSESG